MTSIEKVFEQLEKKGDMRETPSIRNLQLNIDTSDYLELKKQAKEMYKQEIENAYEEGYNRAAKVIEGAVQRTILKDNI